MRRPPDARADLPDARRVGLASDNEPLLAESPPSRFLFTTRDASIGIVLESDGDHLIVDAPVGTLTDTVRTAIAKEKTALLPIVWRLSEMRRLAVESPQHPVVCARIDAVGGPGRCFSCGDLLSHPQAYGRCGPCDVASDLYYSAINGVALCE